MKKKIYNLLSLSFLLLSLLPGQLIAQDLQLVTSVPIVKPESVSIDRFNNIYISDNTGNIVQYDLKGKINLKYSPPKQFKISILESWQAIKLFAFSQDLQQIFFLDRFLTPSHFIKLQEFPFGFIRVATLGNDNNIWLVDDSDISLKKYDLIQQKSLLNIPLNLQLNQENFEITFAREYQNHLFLSDINSGILVFDNMGNYLKALPFKKIKYFNFFDDEIYFLENNKLIFYNFYTLQQRILDIPKDYAFALATKNNLILISNSSLDIYNYK